jgi:hypothetical protein
MVSPLPASDFRAVRHVLDADDYALGGESPPPSDQVEPALWHNIMDLPDDVAIRISDHNGTRLRMLYVLESDWVFAVGDLEKPDDLFECMRDAADCFACANFDLLHGFYRSAIANFRAGFELVMIGTFASLSPNDPTYFGWKNGGDKTLGFSGCRRQLHKACENRASAWVFAEKAFLHSTYTELCKFAHARPFSNDGALWQSNGPVYNGDAIQKSFMFGLDVYSACYLLVKTAKPDFELPPDSQFLFELDWMTHHASCLEAYRQLYEM